MSEQWRANIPKKPPKNHRTLINKKNFILEALTLAQYPKMKMTSSSIRKHPYWPWTVTFWFFNVLSISFWSLCIFAQSRQNSWWRDVKIFLHNQSAFRKWLKSHVGWPLNFWLEDQYAASFYGSSFKFGVGSLNTDNFHNYCTSKIVLFMSHRYLDLRTIDQIIFASLSNNIFFQTELRDNYNISN